MVLLAALLACGGDPTVQGTSEAPSVPEAPVEPQPMAVVRPETPSAPPAAPDGAPSAPVGALALVLSSRGEGEIEPCGCQRHPSGGLARRRTAIDELREATPVVVLEGGESLGRSAAPPGRRGEGQRLAKARLIAEEWVGSGLDAAALGESDWALGTGATRELVERTGIPVVAANLVCEAGARPFPAARVVERGERTIGVVGVTVGEVAGCQVTDPVEAAREARALLGEVDVSVLLWPARDNAAAGAALVGLPFDFVLDARGRSVAEPVGDLPTWVLGGGARTRSLGVVEVGLRTEPEEPRGIVPGSVRARSVALDSAVQAHEATAQHVAAVKASFSSLADAGGAEVVSRPMRRDSGPYLGTEGCVSCHPGPYSQWRRTKHAQAIPALVAVDRHADEACFGCHVTGAQPSGEAGFPVVIADPSEVGGGNNVQCEACHGPGRAHAADPASASMVQPTEATCRTCHTPEQDEGRFDLGSYRPRILHTPQAL
ncbi:MAG: multiheme c-type cytochrome [Myxococcota bacterium]